LRFLAYSIKQFGDEDWSQLDYKTKYEKISNLAVPIVEKLIDLVTDFRTQCENILKEEELKKK
jgi:hypothetical protein